MAIRQAALASDESALEACLRRCAMQIDDLYLFLHCGERYENAVDHETECSK